MFVRFAALCVMVIFSAAAACAGERASNAVRFEDTVAIMSTPGFGAAYGKIMVRDADTLTGASSDCCTAVEIHQSRMSNGVMQMRRLDAVPITPDQPIVFVQHAKAADDASMHLMLIGAKAPLAPGDSFNITLHFAKAGEQNARFTVAKPSAQGHGASQGHE